MSDCALIRRHIDGTVRAIDGRGRYCNQLALYRALLARGTSPTISMMCAQAARRVGEAIAGVAG